jgi:alanyl-tRNA synthetase
MIEQTIVAEERRFEAVLSEGLPRLEAELAKVTGTRSRVLAGETAFRLYDTFGIPFDFIEDTAATQNVTVDKDGFDRAMAGQRDKARAQSAFGRKTEEFVLGAEDDLHIGDEFEGYTSTRVKGVPIVAVFNERREPAPSLTSGQDGYVALGRTPFYIEAGGQVSDSGRIYTETGSGSAVVDGVARIKAGLPRVHRVHVESGALNLRDLVTAEVDADVRNATRRNHTATHLLHAALRHVLGTHVKQAGSLVAPDRLRFDFVHLQPVTQEQIIEIERIVNEQIVRNTPVDTQERSTQDAIAEGAMALFGEKYGDKVRVVSIPGFSMELCGGTHVSATGDIGLFIIVAEGGVKAGVRRIEALTGLGAVAWAQHQRAAVADVADALRVPADQAVPAIERLQGDAKRLARDVTQLKTKLATGGSGGAEQDDVVTLPSGVRLARRKLADMDKNGLRGVADSLKARIQSGVVVLASATDGKVQIVVAVTPDLTSKVKAGQIVKEIAPIVGGGGGGRPDFAEAGGKQPDKIDDMLAASEAVIARFFT